MADVPSIANVINTGGLRLPSVGQVSMTLFPILVIIIILLLLGVAGFFLYRIWRHNIRVIILDSNRRILHDRGRIIDEQGVKKFKLLKYKFTLKPVARKHFWLDGKADTLLFVKPSEGELIPQIVKEGNVESVSEDVRFWGQQERKAKFQKYMVKDKGLMQYLPLAAMIIAIVMIAVVFIIYAGKFEMVAQSISGFTGSVGKLADSIQRINTCNVAASPGG